MPVGLGRREPGGKSNAEAAIIVEPFDPSIPLGNLAVVRKGGNHLSKTVKLTAMVQAAG
jgi:hypothetical protein